MPWKLIITIVFLAFLICLAGFNWGYRSNVSLGFYTFKEVPIIITIGISFLGGALFAIPYAIRSSIKFKKRQQKKLEGKKTPDAQKTSAEKSDKTRAAQRKPGGKKKGTEDQPLPDVSPQE